MARYRNALPQMGSGLFLTDGGIETTLIFHEGLELPDFAAFVLLRDAKGEAALRKYFRAYAAIAARSQAGLILESVTWRASTDWAERLGYSGAALAEANRQAIHLLEEIREEFENGETRMPISGCIGPRGDGYNPATTMSEKEAQAYHAEQVETLARTEADMLAALTMTHAEEATGIVRAAQQAGMPIAVSFTVETDGRLPSGQTLEAAIGQVDAATASYPSYYMINCAHPTHFDHALAAREPWAGRIRGLRANASRKSHAELNDSTELDSGDPVELGAQYVRLKKERLPALNVLGGCCGTDHRHVEQIARACTPLF